MSRKCPFGSTGEQQRLNQVNIGTGVEGRKVTNMKKLTANLDGVDGVSMLSSTALDTTGTLPRRSPRPVFSYEESEKHKC